MRIALTGGTGFVGGALVERAIGEGHEISALARKEQGAREGVSWVRGDLGDPEALRRLVGEADMVIHVAGLVKALDSAAFARANVEGTLNLIEAVRAAGPERLVFVSSLAARGPDLSAYGASKALAERLVMASSLDWTIIRPPAVYGPRDTEMFDLFRAAKWGVVPTPRHGRTALIHLDDLVRLLLAMPRGGEGVTGKIFEPDDGMPGGWDHYELALTIGQALGKRPWVLRLSRSAMEWAARLDTLFRRSRAKMTLDRAAYFSHPDWVVSPPARPPAELWRPTIEARTGLAATAEWYRAEGWL